MLLQGHRVCHHHRQSAHSCTYLWTLSHHCTTVEDAPAGYPRFTALIAAHPSFHICRRYRTIRARLLLLKQDRMRLLEQQLEQLDRAEPRKPFLASIRHDANPQRKQVLEELDAALEDYGTYLSQYAVRVS